MKVYDGEPLQVLFKFSGAQATRRISRAQLPFWSQSLFLFQIRRLIGTDSRDSLSQLELETCPSESSPPSQSESAARLLPDSSTLTRSSSSLVSTRGNLPKKIWQHTVTKSAFLEFKTFKTFYLTQLENKIETRLGTTRRVSALLGAARLVRLGLPWLRFLVSCCLTPCSAVRPALANLDDARHTRSRPARHAGWGPGGLLT
jgi:hypothetical protein